MNLQHFHAFLWLRWRLLVNQMKRGGILNSILLILLGIIIVGLGLGLFAGSFLIGFFAMTEAPSWVFLFVWAGIVLVLLFFWATGLLAELQRSEAVSIQKVLHLPVSPTSAFFINYLSSLFRITLILFLAVAIGLSLGVLFSRGLLMLLMFPLIAAFVLALTAITYQFQGWLASLMSNPRRRRTIIVLVTAGFILLVQIPNLLNLSQPWNKKNPKEKISKRHEEQTALARQLNAGEITPEEYRKRLEKLQREQMEREKTEQLQLLDMVERTTRFASTVLPPGWLALGAEGLAAGNVIPALLATVGFALIGSASLSRAYRTTLRLYTGEYTSGTRPVKVVDEPVKPAVAREGKVRPGVLDRRLPWLSEQASAVALGGFVSLLRAPEAKMMMLTPVILAVVFGTMLITNTNNPTVFSRPLMAFGAMSMVLLSMVQVAGNQFGFDRAGFRVFVLSPAPRRDILLGKNLAFAPLPMAWAIVVLVVLQILYPLRFDHFLSLIPQMISTFLLFCLWANFLSILAPIYVAPGTFKPSNTRILPVLLHLLFFFLFPVVLGPTLLPLGIEFALKELRGIEGIPICLGLSVLGCAIVVVLYLLVLNVQGQLLQSREKAILDVVATKA